MLKKSGVESVKYPLYELSQIQYKTWPIMIWGLNILDPSKWNKMAVRFVVYMFLKSLKRPVGVEISPLLVQPFHESIALKLGMALKPLLHVPGMLL